MASNILFHCLTLFVLVSLGLIVFAENNPKELWFVGNVEGKSYFADSSARMNWTQAGQYCQSFGMELATIVTMPQAELLKYSFHAANFNGSYWIAGRDAFELRQFSWNITGDVVPEFFEITWTPPAYQHCLDIYMTPSNAEHHIHQCSDHAFVLCET